MATSTLIQKLDGTAFESSKTVPGSYTSVATPDVSNRRQVETFIAGGTVAAGDVVALDLSKTGALKALTVVEAPANAGALAIGVCIGSAESDGSLTADSKINVVVTGYVASADVETGVAAGQALVVGSTAGRFAAMANAATSTSATFLSALQTGTGAAQNIAHGLSAVPDLVFVITEDLTAATTAAVTVTYGTHTSTNAIITMNTGKTYRVVAIRLSAAEKQLAAIAGPVAVALSAESGNKAEVFMLKRGF
jgi:hypothetical protein